MNIKNDNIRTILKFDTGADGFLKMIFVLAISAVIVLSVGIYFITLVIKDLKGLA